MFNISNPFSSNNYVPFHWDQSNFSQKALGEKDFFILKNGNVFLPRNYSKNKNITILTESGYILERDFTLTPGKINCFLNRENHNLELFFISDYSKYTSVKKSSINDNVISQYLEKILIEQIELIEQWLDVFVEYSAKRKVGKSNLYAIPSIKIKIAEIMVSLITLKKSLLSTDKNENFLINLSGEIINNLNKFISVVGGRTMLAGNLVEMRFIFNLYNFVFLR